MTRMKKLFVLLLLLVTLTAVSTTTINAQNFGGGSSGGNGASGSWGWNPWYSLNDAFGEAYSWFIYIMSYPLIEYGGTDESWDGQ